MPRTTLAVHERLGTWARQLRPRLAGWPVRWVESRSADDLGSALASAAFPIAVIDLGGRPRAGLEALDRATRAAPEALVLVLDPQARPGVAPLAREMGAALVLSGVVAPPAVAELLSRWIPLARRRAEADGWLDEPEAEPWSGLVPTSP